MEGWVGYLARHWSGTELALSRSRVRRPNHYTTEPLGERRVDKFSPPVFGFNFKYKLSSYESVSATRNLKRFGILD